MVYIYISGQPYVTCLLLHGRHKPNFGAVYFVPKFNVCVVLCYQHHNYFVFYTQKKREKTTQAVKNHTPH